EKRAALPIVSGYGDARERFLGAALTSLPEQEARIVDRIEHVAGAGHAGDAHPQVVKAFAQAREHVHVPGAFQRPLRDPRAEAGALRGFQVVTRRYVPWARYTIDSAMMSHRLQRLTWV